MGSCSRKWTCYLSGPGKPLKAGLYLRKMTLVRPFMSPKSYLHKRSGHSRRVAGLRGSDMLRGKARAQLTAHVRSIDTGNRRYIITRSANSILSIALESNIHVRASQILAWEKRTIIITFKQVTASSHNSQILDKIRLG